MKASDLTKRTTKDLAALLESMKKDLFSNRMKNLTNQLDDTTLLGKTRRDIARVQAILHERALQSVQQVAGVEVEKGSEP
jgi:large subunit ribosomal protein L29